MLEQPPERSEWEIQAELAAAAKQQAPTNRAHGCFRIIIWCSPVFVIGIIIALINSFSFALTYFIPQQIALIAISHAAVFGIGYFDGMLSRKTYAPNEQDRRRKICFHALKFLLWQFLIVPALAVLLVGGACAIIVWVNN